MDAGVYTCQATNEFGRDDAFGTLVVRRECCICQQRGMNASISFFQIQFEINITFDQCYHTNL